MTKRRAKPPGELSSGARRIWARLVAEYHIDDAGGLEVLRSGLRSLEQAEAAEAIVSKDGAVQIDRFGQRKAHPMLAVARDFRAQWVSALRALNLAIGDPPTVGRPEGGA